MAASAADEMGALMWADAAAGAVSCGAESLEAELLSSSSSAAATCAGASSGMYTHLEYGAVKSCAWREV